MQKIIVTDKAPGAIGPYSQAVQAGDFLFASGQIPMDPKTGQMVTGDIKEQTTRVLENVKGLLEGAGFSMGQVVKSMIYITSMEDFAAVNEVCGRYFTENPPSRACVAVKELPKGAHIEIEVVAWKG